MIYFHLLLWIFFTSKTLKIWTKISRIGMGMFFLGQIRSHIKGLRVKVNKNQQVKNVEMDVESEAGEINTVCVIGGVYHSPLRYQL